MGGIKHLTLGDQTVAVHVHRSARAKRISLRVDQVRGVVLVLPPKASEETGWRFVQQHQDWLRDRWQQISAPPPVNPGDSIPILGHPHRIEHHPQARRGVWLEPPVLYVSGAAEHLERRIRDFLTAQARQHLTRQVQHHSQNLQVQPGRITIRDTRSRWGSCSADGDLSFCWRLVMAPDWVLDYVAAHEVAHLRELNHSPRFWALVNQATPHARPARQWLKQNGPHLHQILPKTG